MTVSDKKAYQKVIKARTDLILEHPFFASLALRLKVREDPSCRTAWTDGRIFAYNPGYVKILSAEKMKGLCSHTVMHPACDHHNRRQKRDRVTWNRACDYAINPILLDAGITLPDGFLYDAAFCGKPADAVYALLKEGEPDPSEGEQQTDAPPLEESRDRGHESAPEDQTVSLPGKETETPSEESGQTDPGMSGEVRDSSDSEGEGGEADDETDWEEALVQAAANARSMGKLPRGIQRMVDSIVNPKLCWQQLLARFIEKNTRSDYTWTTPNRRFLHQDLYFPSLNHYELNDVAVAIDTSGSIEKEALAQFGAELSAIMETFPIKLHLVYCDMKVTGYRSVEKWDLPVRFEPVGGGGTDFRPVFAFLSRQGISPACLVYLTDLECRYFPSRHPAYPVLWIQTGTARDVTPPFGSLVRLEGRSPFTDTHF